MEQKLWDIKTIQTKDQAQFVVQVFLSVVYEGNVYQKEKGKEFLEDINENIISRSSSPTSKFYTLWIVQQLVSNLEVKVISQISGHPLFLTLQQFAQIDPRKAASEKGKKLFPGEEKYGNSIVRLCLETLIFLGKKFPYKNGQKSKEPTKFRKVLKHLAQENVIMPEEFMFYENLEKRRMSRESNGETPQKEKSKEKKASIQSLINFTNFKIQQFMGILDDCDGEEELQEQIQKKHGILSKQLKKFQQLEDKVLEEPAQVLDSYLNLRTFLQKQSELFSLYFSSNQFDKYKEVIRMEYDKIYKKSSQRRNNDENQNPMQTSEPKLEKKASSEKKKTVVLKPRNSEVNKVPSSPIATNLMSNIFDRLQSRSKSPVNGFKLVKDSLEKQKKMIQVHPPRNKECRGHSNGGSRIVATAAKSFLKAGTIFTNPPNSSPPFKSYQGQTVKQNRDIQSILYDIKKDQGTRRFKIANLKERYPLFENQSLQIGFKTQTVYGEIDGISQCIFMELFFGNKTTRSLVDFEMFFEGDDSVIIYQSPQNFPENIEKQSQIRHEILIITKQFPFCFLNMKFSYQSKDSSIRASAALPNSLLRFTQMAEISKLQFQSYWQNLTNIYKTNQFKLTRHIPPNTIKKYMEGLSENTNYSDFSLSGSVVDYELYGNIEFKKCFGCVFKLIIRPDLNIVLQIGAIDPEEEQIQLMKFYLQTLQMILKECG